MIGDPPSAIVREAAEVRSLVIDMAGEVGCTRIEERPKMPPRIEWDKWDPFHRFPACRLWSVTDENRLEKRSIIIIFA